MAAGSREGDGRRGWKLQWHGGQMLYMSRSTGQRLGRGRKSEKRVFHAGNQRGERAVPGIGKEIGGRAGGAGLGLVREERLQRAALPSRPPLRAAAHGGGGAVPIGEESLCSCLSVCVFLCFALKVTWTPRSPPAQLATLLPSLAGEISRSDGLGEQGRGIEHGGRSQSIHVRVAVSRGRIRRVDSDAAAPPARPPPPPGRCPRRRGEC